MREDYLFHTADMSDHLEVGFDVMTCDLTCTVYCNIHVGIQAFIVVVFLLKSKEYDLK